MNRASVIESLKDIQQDGEVLAYFYCDFRNERSTNAAEVMRSLLSQLLQQSRRHAVDLGHLIDQLVEERDEGALTTSSAMLLAGYLIRAASQFPRPPILVIEALDECKDITVLLNVLVESRKGGVRLFLTSRPLQIIKEEPSSFPLIDMETVNYLILADIRLHVTKELDSRRRLRVLDEDWKDEIYSALCNKAGGM